MQPSTDTADAAKQRVLQDPVEKARDRCCTNGFLAGDSTAQFASD